MSKQKLFSITADDFEFQTFRVGGNGGQKVNKTNSGVRAIHPPSGARAESRQFRGQAQNKRAAWKKAIETKEFQDWLNLEIERRGGRLALQEQEIQRAVERQMRPGRLRVEVIRDGKWVEQSPGGE